MAATTPYRDRTVEFGSLAGTLRRIERVSAVGQPENSPSPAGSEFKKKASLIGYGIHDASLKIAKLATLANRKSLFDDPIVEIQELTALIKKDITALDVGLSDLKTIQNMEAVDSHYSEDQVVHSKAVYDDLNSRLMAATKQLKEVLTIRTQNMKVHENRKKMFSQKISTGNPFGNQEKSLNEPLPWSNCSDASGSSQSSVLPSDVAHSGNQLRRRLAENAPSQRMEISMLQQAIPLQETYAQSRGVALHNVESTIAELGGIFTNLATMVAHQGELAIRIDDNMDKSVANIEGAHGALLRHFHRISSNRWLIIKIFAVLIIFLIVFIVFVA